MSTPDGSRSPIAKPTLAMFTQAGGATSGASSLPPVHRTRSTTASQATSPAQRVSPPVSPTSPRARLNRSNSNPAPISPRQIASAAAAMGTPPPAPSPLHMAGYLRKLKSEEGASKLGAMFQRSKFNKRWFLLDEVHDGEQEHAGLTYEIKYWKTDTDADSKLPSFVLSMSDVRGCGEGVGLGPFTREPHTFHLETTTRTYVLTASKRDEMLWWITGINFYTWQHKQTMLRLATRDTSAADSATTPPRPAVVVAPTHDAFVEPTVRPSASRLTSVPRNELASPVSSHDDSLFGSPDPANPSPSPSPLPAFSPLAHLSPSPFSPENERVTVQLRDYEATSPKKTGGSTNPFGDSPRDHADDDAVHSLGEDELEHKYDSARDTPAAAGPPKGVTALPLFAASKRPVPGELSSPIRFDNPDIETARTPPHLASPTPFDHSSATVDETARSSPSHPRLPVADADDPFLEHAPVASRYPSLEDLHTSIDDAASAPPQTERPGVEPQAHLEPFAQTHAHALDRFDFDDASAPPQTERAGVELRSGIAGTAAGAKLPPIVLTTPAPALPPTNPHLSPVHADLHDSDHDDDDPFSHHADETPRDTLGETGGEDEASFHVISSGRDAIDAEDSFVGVSPKKDDAPSLPPPEEVEEVEEELEEEHDVQSQSHEEEEDPFHAHTAAAETPTSPTSPREPLETSDDARAVDDEHAPAVDELHEDDPFAEHADSPKVQPVTPPAHDEDSAEEAHIQAALNDAQSAAPQEASHGDRYGEESHADLDLEQSLDAGDESILNGSGMLAESMALEHEARSTPTVVPQLRAANRLPPINSVSALPSIPSGGSLPPIRPPTASVTAVTPPLPVKPFERETNQTPRESLSRADELQVTPPLAVSRPAVPARPTPPVAATPPLPSRRPSHNGTKSPLVATPIISARPTPVASAPATPHAVALTSFPPPRDALQVRLTLDAPFTSVVSNPTWLGTFTDDLTTALAVPPHRIQVVSVVAGSVVVTLNLLGGTGPHEPTPSQLLREMRKQSAEPQSKLRRGVVTGTTKEIALVAGEEKPDPVPAHTSPAPTPSRTTPKPPPAPSAAAIAPSDWQQDLSSLLQQDKLPYEDMLTQRIDPASFAAPALPARPNHGSRLAAAASSSVSQCDECYTSIHAGNAHDATYCWTCQQVLCARCLSTHAGSGGGVGDRRLAQHVTENLLLHLRHQSDAYCAIHALPAPLLVTPIVLASSGVEPIVRGVRPRALRSVGLFEAFCETCSTLLCAKCRAEDGTHATGGATRHIVRDVSRVYAAHATELQRAIHAQVLPKRIALADAVAQHTTRATSLQREAADVRAETMSFAQQSVREATQRRDAMLLQIDAMKARVTEDIRHIEQAERLIKMNTRAAATPVAGSSSAASAAAASPADMCSFLALAPSLIAQMQSLRPPRDSAAAASSSHTEGLPELLFTAHKEQEKILADQKEKEDKIQALPALSHGVSSKDRDLSALLSSRRGLLAESAAQATSLNALYTQAHTEIQEWMRLTEEMTRQIAGMKQACQTCGVRLSAAAANTRCAHSRNGLHAFAHTLTQQSALE